MEDIIPGTIRRGDGVTIGTTDGTIPGTTPGITDTIPGTTDGTAGIIMVGTVHGITADVITADIIMVIITITMAGITITVIITTIETLRHTIGVAAQGSEAPIAGQLPEALCREREENTELPFGPLPNQLETLQIQLFAVR